METQVKTKSVTNTQILAAVAVAVLAGGLAFAAAPHKQKAPACTTASVEWINSCPRAGQYHTARYVCSDGSSGQVVGTGCRTTSKLQQAIDRACSRKQCPLGVVADAPAAPVAPPAPVAPVVDSSLPNSGSPIAEANQCGLRDIQFADSCGKNKYEKVEFTCTDGNFTSHSTNCSSVSALQEAALTACSYRDCRPVEIKPQPESNTDTTGRPFTDTSVNTADPTMPNYTPPVSSYDPTQSKDPSISGTPIVYISQNEIQFHSNGSKVSVGVRLSNRGSAVAGSDVKYTLNFLDGQKNVVQSVGLNLSNNLEIGDEKLFETMLPLPEGALFAEVVVDPSFSDGKDNDVTTMIPTLISAQ